MRRFWLHLIHANQHAMQTSLLLGLRLVCMEYYLQLYVKRTVPHRARPPMVCKEPVLVLLLQDTFVSRHATLDLQYREHLLVWTAPLLVRRVFPAHAMRRLSFHQSTAALVPARDCWILVQSVCLLVMPDIPYRVRHCVSKVCSLQLCVMRTLVTFLLLL